MGIEDPHAHALTMPDDIRAIHQGHVERINHVWATSGRYAVGVTTEVVDGQVNTAPELRPAGGLGFVRGLGDNDPQVVRSGRPFPLKDGR